MYTWACVYCFKTLGKNLFKKRNESGKLDCEESFYVVLENIEGKACAIVQIIADLKFETIAVPSLKLIIQFS